jgi:hypothetical protein
VYRLRIDITYSSVNNANGSVTDINGVLSSMGYTETAQRSGSNVSLDVLGIPDQAAAIALRDALTPLWGARARTGGKVSIVKTDDTSV